MKKHRIGFCFLCVLILCMGLSMTVSADVGTKPSIRISFENMPEASFFGTLLSADSADDYLYGRTEFDGGGYAVEWEPIWNAFSSYEDADGYVFTKQIVHCSEYGMLKYSPLPPKTFKLLLYFPETDSYAVTLPLDKYAYDAYYTLDLGSTVPQNGTVLEEIRKTYNWGAEIFAFFVRMALTVLVEVGVALLFRYRTKPLLYRIAAVNMTTQLLLNLLLFFVNFHVGGLAMFIVFILCEGLIFLVETVLFAILLPMRGGGRWWKAVLYALCANLLSFLAGLRISLFWPLMF